MTANGAGNRDGFEAWVQALQRPPGSTKQPSKPDITAELVDENATHVQQIPKELIHRLRERETQGLLGVEVERTAVFKPPPELLARAKRMKPVAKPEPSEAPAAEKSELPTAPPPEAAVPTVKPPPPTKVDSFEDDWSELESGLNALKPIERSVPAPSARPSRPIAPAFTSAAPRPVVSTAPRSVPLPAAPPTHVAPSVPASNRAPTSGAPVSSSAPGSRPSPSVVVGRTVAVVKNADMGPVPPAPAAKAALDLDIDEPTRIRADGMAALLGQPIQAPTEDLVVERTEPRVQEVAPHVQTLPEAFPAFRVETAVLPDAPAPVAHHVEAPVELPAYDSMAPAALERGASGRRWVVIAAVFLSLVVIALAALRH